MNIYEYAEHYGEHVSDLRRELADDDNARCRECGEEFHARWIPATRLQPAECLTECCPDCGSDHWENS